MFLSVNISSPFRLFEVLVSYLDFYCRDVAVGPAYAEVEPVGAAPDGELPVHTVRMAAISVAVKNESGELPRSGGLDQPCKPVRPIFLAVEAHGAKPRPILPQRITSKLLEVLIQRPKCRFKPRAKRRVELSEGTAEGVGFIPRKLCAWLCPAELTKEQPTIFHAQQF